MHYARTVYPARVLRTFECTDIVHFTWAVHLLLHPWCTIHVQSGHKYALKVYIARAKSACQCTLIVHRALIGARAMYTLHHVHSSVHLNCEVPSRSALGQCTYTAQCTYHIHLTLYSEPCAPFSVLTAHWTFTLHCTMRVLCILSPVFTTMCFFS